MTIHDTYRVVLTFQYANGPLVVEGKPKSLDEAMADFNAFVASGGWGELRQARVISEKTWIESVDASLAEGWNFVADEMDAGRWKA